MLCVCVACTPCQLSCGTQAHEWLHALYVRCVYPLTEVVSSTEVVSCNHRYFVLFYATLFSHSHSPPPRPFGPLPPPSPYLSHRALLIDWPAPEESQLYRYGFSHLLALALAPFSHLLTLAPSHSRTISLSHLSHTFSHGTIARTL